jgi:hypothetical protein
MKVRPKAGDAPASSPTNLPSASDIQPLVDDISPALALRKIGLLGDQAAQLVNRVSLGEVPPAR